MGHLSYEEGKKVVFKGLWLLALVTVSEVLISLFGKGHLIPGVEDIHFLYFLAGFVILLLSLYKAYFIVYYFMHMAYEVRGLRWSVLLPTLLLIWAIIAFFQEGDSWKKRRQQIQEKNKEEVEPTGFQAPDPDVYRGLI
ncbi:MAG: hypothetical protein D6765_00870 [Bacteroidetes bacterium]|nr:MAG: hypothetical protein D6765_00870 [Bacteroidota bacterium]